MADSYELVVHFQQLDPARARRCPCTSKWQHLYFHCRGTDFPSFDLQTAVPLRTEKLATALRDYAEVMAALKHDLRYWDFRQALLCHDRNTFIWFLQNEPFRLEYYWNSRPMNGHERDLLHAANLASTFLPFCNIGRVVLARLLCPAIHEDVFGEPITQEVYNVMLRAKKRYIDLWHELTKHGIQYGSMAVTAPIYRHYQHYSNTNRSTVPIDSMYGSGLDTAIIDISGNEASQDTEQERQDSAVTVDENDQKNIAHALENVVEMDLDGSITNGRLFRDATELLDDGNGEGVMSGTASEDVSIISEILREGAGLETTDDERASSRSALGIEPDINGYPHESNSALENAPAVDGHPNDLIEEGQVSGNESLVGNGQLLHRNESNGDSTVVQDRSSRMREIADLAVQLLDDFRNLRDSRFEIARQQHDTTDDERAASEQAASERAASRRASEWVRRERDACAAAYAERFLGNLQESGFDIAQQTPETLREIAGLAEQFLENLENLQESGFDIAQHPETLRVLRFVMGLGRAYR